MVKIKKSGFTLIEIMVVVMIIGLLTTLIMISITDSRVKARDVKRLNDIQQIRTALEQYYQDNNVYPSSITPGQALKSVNKTYLKVTPKNTEPRNDGSCADNDFIYLVNGAYSSYTLSFCLGVGTDDFLPGNHIATYRSVK